MTAPLSTEAREAATLRLQHGLKQLALVLAPAQIAQLMDYLELLLRWGTTFNLTAIRDAQAAVDHHLLDSLSLVPVLLARGWGASRLADIGSGAGLPGIPLAIALPQLRVTTIDAVQKKVSFQIQAKGALGLANVSPLHARVQALTFDERFDLCVSRAFSSLAEMADAARPLLAPGGAILAMKGVVPGRELAGLAAAWQAEVKPLEVPHLAAQRCVVVLTAAAARADCKDARERVHG